MKEPARKAGYESTYARGLDPKALLRVMRGVGLVVESATQMGGVTATEFRFAPNAAGFVTKVFKAIP
jgi:hypothetical protein